MFIGVSYIIWVISNKLFTKERIYDNDLEQKRNFCRELFTRI